MSEYVMVKRELLERIFSGLTEGTSSIRNGAELRAVLTQEAGKCGVCGQGAWACNEGGCHYLESGNGEPVAEVVMVDPFVLTTGNLHLLRKGDKLYTSPPARVSVVLPDPLPRSDRYFFDLDLNDKLDDAEAKGFNRAIDKFKELNQ